MDLALYLRVVWRFRMVIAAGTVLALALAVAAVARVGIVDGKPTLTYRESELWQSRSTLLVTQRGFPWGRATLPLGAAKPGASDALEYAEPSRFTGLATLYAQFAQSDAVKDLVGVSPPEKVLAQPVIDMSTGSSVGSVLPLVAISGISQSPSRARALSARATEAFRRYIEQEQRAARIRPADRVVLELVNSPSRPSLFAGRRMTPAILAFLVVMMATFGLAFVLENLRRSRPLVEVEAGDGEGPVSEAPFSHGRVREAPERQTEPQRSLGGRA